MTRAVAVSSHARELAEPRHESAPRTMEPEPETPSGGCRFERLSGTLLADEELGRKVRTQTRERVAAARQDRHEAVRDGGLREAAAEAFRESIVPRPDRDVLDAQRHSRGETDKKGQRRERRTRGQCLLIGEVTGGEGFGPPPWRANSRAESNGNENDADKLKCKEFG